MLPALSVASNYRLTFMLKLERFVKSFPSKVIAIIGFASTDTYAERFCVLTSMLMGSSFGTERKPEVGLRV